MSLYKPPVKAVPSGWEAMQEGIVRPRLIISSRGENGDGKTDFGLSAPGPIACFPFDNNTLEIVRKRLPGKKILVPAESLDYTKATEQENWKPIWDRFAGLWREAVASTSIRTIMADTFTEANELCRLAEFGKLSEVPAHFYGKVNAKFKMLIDLVYPTDKNLILVHRLKDEYERSGKKGEGVRTGNRILAGYGEVKYKAQINLLHWRSLEPYDEESGIGRDEEKGIEGFAFTVERCTQQPSLAGKYLAEPNNKFKHLAMLAYPETDESVWDVTGY